MSGIFGFIINAIGIFAPLGVELESAASTPTTSTSVQLIVGSSANDSSLGGNVPSIALWDDDGNRIGQYRPKSKDKIKEGDTFSVAVPNNVNPGEQADPYYVMLSNFENDAICISAITVANEKISATVYGDTGYVCGQSWFPSDNKIGSEFQKPKCVWLDGDHTNGINARAMSFHVNDMAPTTDKMVQYQDRQETLCQSTPRFSFWGNMLPDSEIPIFSPKLEYNTDSSGSGEGADVDPDRVVDKPNQYNKGVYLYQSGGGQTKRMDKTPRSRSNSTSANHNPEHLIITNHPSDDVREVCEHPNSYGWDIASTVQRLYCDMETKQLYQLCNSPNITTNCFNVDDKGIVPKAGLNSTHFPAGHMPKKVYKTFAYWEA